MQERTSQAGENGKAAAFLRPFEPRFAAVVAGWVRSAPELLWLAPSTAWPLTAEKVAAWTATRGRPYLLHPAGEDGPVAYGELNPVVTAPRQMWLGHLLVDNRRRGEGWGRLLTEALVAEAFGRLGAERIILVVFPDNSAAVRCYVRLGFRLRTEEHHRSAADGRVHRLARYELEPHEARIALAPLPNQRRRS